ncbi:hypothetical protein Poli38472_008021 [Pythium oligandrum]|uniref:Uncharacterized protein n=1 Tax=Pythium oligandrum TaxID=41045 RepID=A0A8K1CKU5_PYTOL|nr:hypothetical protein Poli38472_008021 [Pythium oligandrum]|eukprot:TMW65379.1 hypothetical protein Poli38472_008021 [Pythium oligandrum]
MFLQSYQAYRLSRFVPRLWLNRVYVALVVLHCWSTPLIRIVFKRRVVLSRLYLLLGAALLDLFSTIGLAVILLTTYYKDYDPEIGGFPQSFWYNDEWVVNFFNEFHLVLVVSWIDLLNQILFYTGIIGAMENIKELLEQTRARARLQVGPTTTALATKEPSVGPVLRSNTLVTPPRHRFDRVAHTGLVIWGLVVLCLHVHGQTQQQLSQCLMQVRPWTATRPACVLLSMDCSQANVLGHEDDITPLWEVADPTAVTRIVIRHCPELRMPTILQTFHRLDTLKLCNCTIVNWADSAAITNQHHPVLTAIFVVRVNFPNGQLPPGMVSSDYPQSVYDSEFIVTNLRTLPDDLDTKWPHGGSIYIEMSQLEQFPSVLLRLEPTDLSLAVNHLTEFPVEAMQIPDMVFLSLAANPISTLETIPYTDVVDNGVLANLKLMETNVSSLPRWLDSLLDRGSPSQPSVNLHHSPFCWYVRELKNGTRLHFPAVDTTPEDELATVMLLSDVAAITQSVSCRYYFVTLYPLESEDEWSALTPVDRPSK